MNKKRSTSESAFFNMRIVIGLAFCLFAIVLSLFAAGVVPSPSSGVGQGQPQQATTSLTKSLSIAAKGITMRFPEGWSAAQPTLNSWVILNVPADQQDTATPTVRVLIGYLDRPDHADAVSQLAEYANESRKLTTFLTIGGWPALQRVQLVKRPQPSQGPMFPDRNMVQITTAVAAGNLLVRLEAALPSDADQQLKDAVLAIGQSLTFESASDPAQVEQ